MGEIKLDLAPYGHECDTCQNANYRRPGMSEPRFPSAIYALTIGAGYRQPSYLCPNCLDVVRVTLGVKNLRVVADNAERNTQLPELHESQLSHLEDSL